MQTIEKVEQLFHAIKKGNYSLRDEFFEVLWLNITKLAHGDAVKPFLLDLEDWANAHGDEHPDFLELTNLSIGSIEFHSDNFESAISHLNKAHEMFAAKKG